MAAKHKVRKPGRRPAHPRPARGRRRAAGRPRPAPQESAEEAEPLVEETSEESFPTSDAPSWAGGVPSDPRKPVPRPGEEDEPPEEP